jgi:hypothetical protein
MELSFNEIAVLAAANVPKTREALARDAARLYPSTKFDATLALAEIRGLEARRFLQKTQGPTLEITGSGWAALMQAQPVIENLRAALAGVHYRVIR